MVVGILCFVDLLRGWFSVASCLRLLRRIDVYNVHKVVPIYSYSSVRKQTCHPSEFDNSGNTALGLQIATPKELKEWCNCV